MDIPLQLTLAYIPLIFVILILIGMGAYEYHIPPVAHTLLVISSFLLLSLSVLLMFGVII
jgi:hypothetical protein